MRIVRCKQLTLVKRISGLKVACNHKMSAEATTTSRGLPWCDNEVRALIAIWGEGNIQEELDGAVRNQVVFAKKMTEQGYNRDWKECRAKVKNLKKSTGK